MNLLQTQPVPITPCEQRFINNRYAYKQTGTQTDLIIGKSDLKETAMNILTKRSWVRCDKDNKNVP